MLPVTTFWSALAPFFFEGGDEEACLAAVFYAFATLGLLTGFSAVFFV